MSDFLSDTAYSNTGQQYGTAIRDSNTGCNAVELSFLNENRRVAFEEHLTVAKQKKSLWETAIKTGARFFKPQAVALVLSATVFFTNSLIANPFSFASDTQKNTDSKVDVNRITELLEQLPVKGRAPKTGYSRSAFGPQWSDVDRNGCDTRNDILKRDLTNLVFRAKTRDCVVETGTLLDPFSNSQIDFQRGVKSSMLVQIDHVVSLSNAWQTGIFRATLKTRTEFANDPINLLAVKGSLNSQKGDGDAATWLPPNKAFRCKYVSTQVEVKSKYQLWVTAAERDAIVRVLANC